MGSWIDIDFFYYLSFWGWVWGYAVMVKCMGSVIGMRLWLDTPRIDGEHVESLKRGREWAHWRNEIQGRTEEAGMGEGEDLGVVNKV